MATEAVFPHCPFHPAGLVASPAADTRPKLLITQPRLYLDAGIMANGITTLWNVLVGEMSLVGPRPTINDQRQHYRVTIALYDGVLPGLSGQWQVSGRSDTTYEERVLLDTYYVRNWSLWLDIWILARNTSTFVCSRRLLSGELT